MEPFDYASFGTVMRQIEAGEDPGLSLPQTMALADFARSHRIPLGTLAMRYINRVVGQHSAPGTTTSVEDNGSRFRIVVRRKGKQSSLDDDDD